MSAAVRFLKMAFLLPILLLTACSLTGNYNSDAHRQLVMLQALHMQFIDDATADDEKSIWQDNRDYRLQYRAATLFAEDLGDPLRLSNLRSLNTIYQAQYQRREQQQRPFNAAQEKLFGRQAASAYQQAIRGECLRPRSVCYQGNTNVDIQ
ncbi:hypothetical protein [Yokenella regensburgei]|uniref:hypothetical protein n=1 Tax=Yokenella regensburgei TaxID=158877 RepID=UPI002076D9CE|nr:hypothetical protein [Yokenella regensburgei]